MPDIETLSQLGLATLSMIVVIFAIDLIRRKYRESDNGDRRRNPMIVQCPNKIETLAVILESLDASMVALRNWTIENTKALQRMEDGIATLVDQHKPVNGKETWKFSPKLETALEETCYAVKDLVREIKNGRRKP